MSRTRKAFEFSADMLEANQKGSIYLWTFTFAAFLEVKEARRQWSQFLRVLRQRYKRHGKLFQGLRVFEMHPGGHGLHIHVLTADYLHVNEIRAIWGRGRVHVKPIPYNRRHYPGKYLSRKGRDEALKGARLWAAFGGQEHCKCKEVVIESNWTRAYAALVATVRGFKQMRWFERAQAVANVLVLKPWWYGLYVKLEDAATKWQNADEPCRDLVYQGTFAI